ncbi:hypothetical protein EMCRGX_G033518 [Ephydatia muelleri]
MSDKVEGKSAIKKRIRSINRLLAKEDLPESVRITKEAALKSLHGLLNDRQKSEQQKKIIKKYKMVKFFDKRKVSRRLKSTLLAISQSADDTEKLELLNEAKRLKDELNYVVHYPSTEKYISLYPTTETSSAKAQKRRGMYLYFRVYTSIGTASTDLSPGSQLTVTTQQERVEVPLHFVSPLKKGGKQKRKMSTSVSKNADSGIAVKSGAAVDEEPESISDIYEHTKQKLKQDSFFL